jgi:enoyl-CoA hydratase
VDGRVGRIILNRPEALNALTPGMVQRISSALEDWRDAALRAVLIESASDKAFCAGGDIRAVRQYVMDGRADLSDAFFEAEYAVNLALASYPVPVIAVVDGMCMGGGLGLTVHGPYRLVTARASFAMPETHIGFFPDVGGSHFLPRLPGAVGRYLGLTGARFSSGDALACGVATHVTVSEALPGLATVLTEDERPVDAVLRDLQPARLADELIRSSTLHVRRPEIDWAFGPADLADVFHRLRDLTGRDTTSDVSRWAEEALRLLDKASPSSLALTDLLTTWGREHDLEECLEAERYVAGRVTIGHDFQEGVRAMLVDKDRAPAWVTPARPVVSPLELDAVVRAKSTAYSS